MRLNKLISLLCLIPTLLSADTGNVWVVTVPEGTDPNLFSGVSGSTIGDVFAASNNVFTGTTNTFTNNVVVQQKIGAGTATPSTTLHVYTSGFGPQVKVEGSNAGRLDFYGNGTASTNMRNFGLASANNVYGTFEILQSDSSNTAPTLTRLAIDKSGNVGIGTNIPSCSLNVFGSPLVDGGLSAPCAFLNNSTAYNSKPMSGVHFGWKYKSDGSMGTAGGIALGKENTSDNDYSSYLSFFSARNGGVISERMRINSFGSVGIGTLTPTETLSVSSTVSIIANGSVSPAAVADRVILYTTNAASAVLYCINGAGTRKQLSNHDANNDMVEHDINDYTGEDRSVNIMKLAAAIEKISAKLSAQGDSSFNDYTNILTVTKIPKHDFRADRKAQLEAQGYTGDTNDVLALPVFLQQSQRVFDSVHPDWRVDRGGKYITKHGKKKPIFNNDNGTSTNMVSATSQWRIK